MTICRACDRGDLYCSRHQRRTSLKAARRRHRETPAGRRQNAEALFASVDLIECQIEHTCRDLEQGLGCEPEHTEVELACIPKPEETCTIYRAKYEECGGTDENVDIECQIEINDGIYFKTLECGLAVGDYYACLGGLDCADLLGNTGCEQESSAVDDLCWR